MAITACTPIIASVSCGLEQYFDEYIKLSDLHHNGKNQYLHYEPMFFEIGDVINFRVDMRRWTEMKIYSVVFIAYDTRGLPREVDVNFEVSLKNQIWIMVYIKI